MTEYPRLRNLTEMRAWIWAGLLIALVIAVLAWYVLYQSHHREAAGRVQADKEDCEKAMAQVGDVSLYLNTTYGELIRIFGQPHDISGGDFGGNALFVHWWGMPIEIQSTPLGQAIFMRLFWGIPMDSSPRAGPLDSLRRSYTVTAYFVGSKKTFPSSLYKRPTRMEVRVPFQGSLQGVRMGDSPESFLATSPSPKDHIGPGKFRKIASRSGTVRTECLVKDGKIFNIEAIDTRWTYIFKQGSPQGGRSR